MKDFQLTGMAHIMQPASSLWYKTDFKVDLIELKEQCYKICWNNETQDFHRQISIQTGGSEDWLAGVGSMPNQDESDFLDLHPSLKGSWWEYFFKSLPWTVYRTRIMHMPGKTCYSIHKDTSPRLHIAIDTNDQCKFIFADAPEIIHIPADSYVYWVDTRHNHTAMNGSNDYRIHLVMCIK